MSGISDLPEDEEDWDRACYSEAEMAAGYHQLSLDVDQIIVIDTAEKYKQCMLHLTQPGSVVGIDSEWKPAFCGQIQK